MSSPARKEWVKLRYTPPPASGGPGVRVTLTVQEDNVSVSWTVKRFATEPLKPAVAEARKCAEKALAELKEALNDTKEESDD